MASTSDATPWVEKYRPRSLDEVSHQHEVVATLQNAIEDDTNSLPHLLLYGPPGTGKTSVALALCRTLWDPSQLSKRVLELNASDERGISVVRNKIKYFASLAVGTDRPTPAATSAGSAKNKAKAMNNFFKAAPKKSTDEEKVEGETKDKDGDVEMVKENKEKSDEGEESQEVTKSYPNPPFKIIILDEADTVTRDAQSALRRIIEATSKITRFILICNYVTRIIEPLASRCAKYRFQPLPPSSMMNRLIEIATAEQCRFSIHYLDQENEEEKTQKDGVLKEILDLSQGDMRRAVTTLQSAHMMSGGSGEGVDERTNLGFIRKDHIAEMAGLPPSSVVTSLIDIMKDKSSNFDTLEKTVTNTLMDGYSVQHILSELVKVVIKMDNSLLHDLHKADIAIKIAESDKNLVDGADESLQLLMVCTFIQKCFKISIKS